VNKSAGVALGLQFKDCMMDMQISHLLSIIASVCWHTTHARRSTAHVGGRATEGRPCPVTHPANKTLLRMHAPRSRSTDLHTLDAKRLSFFTVLVKPHVIQLLQLQARKRARPIQNDQGSSATQHSHAVADGLIWQPDPAQVDLFNDATEAASFAVGGPDRPCA